MYIEYTFSVII